MKYVAFVGRVLFSAIFVLSGPHHFRADTIAYAASTLGQSAYVLVPLAGALDLVGGLSVLFGYKTRIGAGMIAVFLFCVTLTMHRFWIVHDPEAAALQQLMFMKNMSMLGGALMIAYCGAGPVSVDGR